MKKWILIIVGVVLVISLMVFIKFPSSSYSEIKRDEVVESDKPELISTNPPNLTETLAVSPTQIIELNFNIPLENIGEFKYKIDPKVEVKTELSSDRKKIKISPVTTFKLGTTYQIEIFPDSKFNIDPTQKSSQKKLERTLFVKFKIIDYRGV